MPVLNKKNKKEVEKVKKFLENSKYGILYQSFEWAELKQDKWTSEYVYVEENGEIVAAMMVLVRKIAKFFNMMYATRGPVADINDVEMVKKLTQELTPLVKKYNPFVLKMDPEVEYSEELAKKYRKNGFKVKSDFKDILELMQPIRNMILDIDGKTEEEILAEYSQKTRYNIKVANKKGVTIRYSNSEEDLKEFYNLMIVTAKRDKIALRTYDHFKKMIDVYKEKSRIYMAEYEGKVLAAAIAINYAGKVMYFYGASSNENRNVMPCYAMQQEMIRWAIETKCRNYDFGGIFNITKDNGLYRFKEGFCRKKGATKFIGEIDKVYNRPYYYTFCKILPKVKRAMLDLNERKNKIKDRKRKITKEEACNIG